MADGELVGSDDDVAVEVGDGYFGGGNHVEAVEGDGVHLSLLVGKLPGAKAGGFVDHERGHDFNISGGGGLVEEEVDEGALQSGSLAFVDGESGSGYFVAEFKVDDVVFSAEVPVGQGTLGQDGFGAEFGHDDVVGFVLSARYGDVGCVGQGDEFGVEVGLDGGLLVGEFFFLALEVGGAGFLGIGFFAFALFEEHAYLFGDGVLLGFYGVGLLLKGAALFVERKNFGYAFFYVLYVLNLEAFDDFLGMFLDILQLQHKCVFLFKGQRYEKNTEI